MSEDDDNNPPPLKRHKKSCITELPEGFHWEGQKPQVILDSGGRVVKKSRCVIDCPGNEWFFSFIHKLNENEHVCLLCDLDVPDRSNVYKTPGGRNSNVIEHLKNKHQLQMAPWQHINSTERRMRSHR